MKSNINQLLEIMRQLRDPENGCPWDIKQDFSSIAPYTIEEAYEVADAIEENDMSALRSELGDLLFQVVFHAQMAAEASHFDFNDVVEAVCEKMTVRHPHVFQPDAPKLTAEEQTQAWEQAKSKNKDSVLDGIAKNLPELLKAVKLTKYAAVTGFDWPDVAPVFAKLDEERDELKEAIESGDKEHMEEELGDLLFVVANIGRHLSIDPSAALRKANHKFEKRFRKVEELARLNEPKKQNFDLKTLDELWNQVKVEHNND
ncbi:nucleoside triphosphate pyrophosphohydrolase [Marinicella sp. S1101]|uniref:nucleoside triphosphate pyrophosphohydrolase n=1 Tax=Marinicella marina TaxID=2996016 RepID=UPI0022608F58|nr:nucleoside triphosphate pyrophosphohydrolase [Marinicella marina]MCX7554568.1 nucleoside triphosphate pyrophosphohydrolase [Marinicella marina]MDJ1141048.1 nucleoside triphosphate pyrophosphohydrolase [Marinicella marina]